MKHHGRQVGCIVGIHRDVKLILKVKLAGEYVAILGVSLHVALVYDRGEGCLHGLGLFLLQR